MRVLLITQDLNIGGAQRAIVELANHMVKSEHEVTLISLVPYPQNIFKIDEQVNLIVLSTKESNNIALRNISRVIKIRREINKLNPDKVISFLEHINILTLASTIGCRSKISVCIRNDPRRKKMSLFHDYFRRMSYPFADEVVVQTESVREWALSLGLNETITVIPNFVRKLELRKKNYESSSIFKISVIGRLVEQKGIDILFKALSKIQMSSMSYSLNIYGEGELLESLTRMSEELGLSSRVFFKGATSEVNKVLAESDLFILSSRYEGYPNTLVEALTTGTPSISFDCPSGPRDITRNGELGMLIEDGNVKKLAEGILIMYESLELRSQFGKKSHAYYSNFNNKKLLGLWVDA